jgi:hypothetical protein
MLPELDLASALVAGQERAEAAVVVAGDEGRRHGHQDLFGVRQADPHAVAHGIGQLHLGLVRAAPAVPAGDLAGLGGAAAGGAAAEVQRAGLTGAEVRPDRARLAERRAEPGREGHRSSPIFM